MKLHLMLTASLACGAAWLAGASTPLRAGQQPPAALFTAEQAAAGRASYQTNCASCHLPAPGGPNEAPQLAGANFINAWRTRTTRDLFEYIQSAMPPSGENLGADQYLAITTFILQANGAQAGTQPFTPTTTAPIGSVAPGATKTAAGRGGQAATATTATPTGRGGLPAGAAGGRGAAAAAGRGAAVNVLGLTVTGEVKSFVPVTDEMLRNQEAGDWLMARRNYQGWSHSPLTQITRENVKDLQLTWAGAMNEGQTNEPTPIVHNGVMFLTNTTNIVQALDAKSGELIWEHRVGPNTATGIAAMRNMAIYQDKVFVATTDARLVAL